MSDLQELSLEQLHYDLQEVKEALQELPTLLADQLPPPVTSKDLSVTVENATEPFSGEVEVKNKVQAHVDNLSEVTDEIAKFLETLANKQNEKVYLESPELLKNFHEFAVQLKKLSSKETTVHVKAPDVTVSVDDVNITNWPSKPDSPIAVRLSDGKNFINELVRVIGGGSGPVVYSKQTDSYQISNIDTASNPSYFGYQKQTGGWYIMRNTDDSTFEYAMGVSDYDTGWTGRAGLTYGRYGDVFVI